MSQCIAGCGFFGNEQLMGLCSSCYKQQTGQPAAKKPEGEGKAAEERRKVVTPDGVAIVVCFGDLTVEAVDAIVNAANSALDHASGLAGAIIKKGGRSIQEESHQYVQTHGRLEDGEVCVTKAGTLPCKHIIHAVGPIYYDGTRGEQIMLEVCINNVLQLASTLNLRSISIPAISSGVFNYPKPACAKVILDNVTQFLQSNKTSSLKEIRLTNFDKETVDCFVAEFDKRYPNAAKPPQPVPPVAAPAPPVAAPAPPVGPVAPVGGNIGITVTKRAGPLLEEVNHNLRTLDLQESQDAPSEK